MSYGLSGRSKALVGARFRGNFVQIVEMNINSLPCRPLPQGRLIILPMSTGDPATNQIRKFHGRFDGVDVVAMNLGGKGLQTLTEPHQTLLRRFLERGRARATLCIQIVDDLSGGNSVTRDGTRLPIKGSSRVRVGRREGSK